MGTHVRPIDLVDTYGQYAVFKISNGSFGVFGPGSCSPRQLIAIRATAEEALDYAAILSHCELTDFPFPEELKKEGDL